MFNILCHQGNRNQNSLRFFLTLVRMAIIYNLRKGRANALMVRLLKSVWRCLKKVIGSGYSATGYMPKGPQVSITQRWLHTCDYCNTIHNKTRQAISLDGYQQMGRQYTVYIFTVEFYSAGKWIDQDIIMLSEIKQIQKECLIHRI